jgi:hypothetical protein
MHVQYNNIYIYSVIYVKALVRLYLDDIKKIFSVHVYVHVYICIANKALYIPTYLNKSILQ